MASSALNGAHAAPAASGARFSAALSASGDKARMTLGGTADLVVQESLETFLRESHAYIDQQRARSVVVDIRALEFMSSGCIRLFVSWAFNVGRQPPERQYRIVFVVDPEAESQRRSIDMLTRAARTVVGVAGVGVDIDV